MGGTAFVRLAVVLNRSRGAIGKCMLRGGVVDGGGEQDKSHHNPYYYHHHY